MEYKVTITRTFVQRATVTIKAENELNAKYLAEWRYYDGDYEQDFIDMEDFASVEFNIDED